MHLPPFTRFLVRWIKRLVFIVVFVGIPGSLLYLREAGLEFGLKEKVAAALSSQRYKTTIGRLRFDPFNGLIAENVQVTEASASGRDLAHVERIVISIALSDLLMRKISIDFIELDQTDISIPLGGDLDSPRLNLQDVSAQCVLLAGQLRLSYFDANLAGIRIMLSGLLQNPQAFHLQRTESKGQTAKRHEKMSDILEQLGQIRYTGIRPQLRAEITGDLADLSTLKVSPITFTSGPIVGPNWRVDGVEMGATYAKGVFALSHLVVKDRDGTLTLSGQYQDKNVEFEVSSTLPVGPFRGLFPKDSPLRELRFAEPPQFSASGSINFDGGAFTPDVTGSLKLGKFTFRGLEVDDFGTEFAWKDKRFFARGIDASVGGGQLTSDVLYAPDGFRLRLSSSIKPTVFGSLLGEKERNFLKLLEFREAPQVQIELKGDKPEFASLSGAGTVKLGRTAMRSIWFDSVDTKVNIADRALTFHDFTVTQGKGVGTGAVVYDFGGQQVRLNNVNSTLSPVDVLMWVDPKIAEAVRPYKFQEPPKVHAEGMVHLKDPRKNNLNLNVQSADGLDYELLKKVLHFGRTAATVGINGTKVNANISNAQLMGGDVALKASVSIDPQDPTFGADVQIHGVDFAKLTKLYFNYDDSQGVFSGNYSFKARNRDEENMEGSGSIKVDDGHVLSIPVLGPLSDIISKLIPGAGYQTAREATADFTIADQKINTKNLTIEGAGFSLYGYGDIYFMKDKMDLSVRINARGLPGIVLFPVSKLFEYVSTGSLSKPEWRPKIIPRFDNEP
jgi:AsmA-like C-terminal region